MGEGIGCKNGSKRITAKVWFRIIKELKQYNSCGEGVEEMAQET